MVEVSKELTEGVKSYKPGAVVARGCTSQGLHLRRWAWPKGNGL